MLTRVRLLIYQMLEVSLMLLGMIPIVFGCSCSKSNRRPHVNGIEEADKVVLTKKDSGKSVLDNSGKKYVHSNNSVNHESEKAEDSRLEILSEDMEENFGVNVNRKGICSSGKMNKKIKQQVNLNLDANHQELMKDELKDSEIRKALHQEMMDSVLLVMEKALWIPKLILPRVIV
ncbi:hypothetical protein Ddye_012400 [Dipteronia dyeriana]|uniref:Uncharacterized protein n=1 Tax=Dipteronia dyeriana TaxID=168575 RepID=A0AAD9X4D3_9ROSI|nr:hypothetical protein Ddye_012400 [Dipteronia dyeriana]